MKPELMDKLLAKKAAQDAARDKWRGVTKPASVTVKSLDERLQAIEKMLGLRK